MNVGTPAVSLASKISALSQPAIYPDHPTAVELIQTHFACVFLTGQFAYKLKKPLTVRGADLATVAARETACREELRLNLRLGGATYLGVIPLRRSNGGLALDGGGAVVDWLVKMRQLPRGLMLDSRLRQNRLTAEDLVAVVLRLAEFWRALPAEPLDAGLTLSGVEARIREAMVELGRDEFGLPSAAVRSLAAQFAAVLPSLESALRARAVAGRIREGHGDLRAEHIWLGPPVQIIDALEFNRTLRLLDAAEELAMLAVDLERHGGAWAAPLLIESYRGLAADPVPDPLWRFYCAVRAATRAKVAIWHLESPDEYPDREPWRRAALEWMGRAVAWLAEPAVTSRA